MSEPTVEQGIVASLRLMAAHWGLWFAETAHQQGLEAALAAEAQAGDRAEAVVAGHLARALGRKAPARAAELLSGLPPETLEALHVALAVSWLAMDGVWFQAVEGLAPGQAGMGDAKRVNDTCWSRFAPLEARRIMALAGIPEKGGLPALRQALGLRLYARINQWDVLDQTGRGFTFRMLRCRVQDARQRKGLADYPCKSGGLVEYTGFARAVDPAIRTTCLLCPPDRPAAEAEACACAWRFELP